MADLLNETVAANYGKHVINQADVGRELIVKVALTNMTNANVTAIRNAITLPGGSGGTLPADTGDAFTVAAIGTADGSAEQLTLSICVFKVQVHSVLLMQQVQLVLL